MKKLLFAVTILLALAQCEKPTDPEPEDATNPETALTPEEVADTLAAYRCKLANKYCDATEVWTKKHPTSISLYLTAALQAEHNAYQQVLSDIQTALYATFDDYEFSSFGQWYSREGATWFWRNTINYQGHYIMNMSDKTCS
jgi:hypothetical protein